MRAELPMRAASEAGQRVLVAGWRAGGILRYARLLEALEGRDSAREFVRQQLPKYPELEPLLRRHLGPLLSGE